MVSGALGMPANWSSSSSWWTSSAPPERDQEQAVLAQPEARLLAIGDPGRVAAGEPAQGIDQIALQMRAVLWRTVAVGAGRKVAVDDQGQ